METRKVTDALRLLRESPDILQPARIRERNIESRSTGVLTSGKWPHPVEMNRSIFHNIPSMQQKQESLCWYTSLQMLVSYYRMHQKGFNLKDPAEDPGMQRKYNAGDNTGVTRVEREQIAASLGLTSGYVSVNSKDFWELLFQGPVIYAGQSPGQLSGHWVLITGISESFITINNPTAGQQKWDFSLFASRYHLQTNEHPLIYAKSGLNKPADLSISCQNNMTPGITTGIAGVMAGASLGSSGSPAVAAGLTAYKAYDPSKMKSH